MGLSDYYSRIYCCIFFVLCSNVALAQDNQFNYSRYLFGTPPTLTLGIQSLNAYTGNVTISGGDSRAPSDPFTWKWGDGNITSGFFPQSHQYSDNNKNYLVKVIANYSDGTKDSSEILVRFTAPSINEIEIPPSVLVKIPEVAPSLGTRLYPAPDLTVFDESHFTIITREVIEYILSLCAFIQNDFVNNNVYHFEQKFEQVMLRDSTFGGAYSLWFTNPVAFGVGEGFLKENIQYSSFFHEMGHNFTLNTPADFYYGGRIDGNANAIFSESMANIFQHAAGYEIVNNYEAYGLSPDLMYDIKQNLIATISVVRKSYDRYITNGKVFSSWNDPNTIRDETFDTFMTVAYKFLEKAEISGMGYRQPLKKMLLLLQGFNSDWKEEYDQENNNFAADNFRSTLFVAAISYAFSTDLRDEFRELNFPVDDVVYDELYNSVTSVEIDQNKKIKFNLHQNYPNPFNPSTKIEYFLPHSTYVKLKVYDILGREVAILLSKEIPGGRHCIEWNASRVSSGIYYYSLAADKVVMTKKMVVMK